MCECAAHNFMDWLIDITLFRRMWGGGEVEQRRNKFKGGAQRVNPVLCSFCNLFNKMNLAHINLNEQAQKL